MGGSQSSPVLADRSARNGLRSTLGLKNSFRASAATHGDNDNNNNNSCSPDSGYNDRYSVRRHRSMLAQGWNMAKRTATAVMPSMASQTATSDTGSSIRTKSSKSLCSSQSRTSSMSFVSEIQSPLDANLNFAVPIPPQNNKEKAKKAKKESFRMLGGRTKDIANNNKTEDWNCQISSYPQGFFRLIKGLTFSRDSRSQRCSQSTSSSSDTSLCSAAECRELNFYNKSVRQHDYGFGPSESVLSSCSSEVDPTNFLNSPQDMVHSSTADLLLGLGRFVAENCKVTHFEPAQLVMWLRSVDRFLMLQGWQDIAFVNPANLVFVYFLVREQLEREYESISTTSELQSLVKTCLYVSYSYLGNEISYPLKPFISATENRKRFWNRCVTLINEHSEDMLRLNASTDFFLDVFTELRTYACFHIY